MSIKDEIKEIIKNMYHNGNLNFDGRKYFLPEWNTIEQLVTLFEQRLEKNLEKENQL